MNKKISFKEAFKFGINSVIDNAKTFSLISLLYFGGLLLLAGTIVVIFKLLGLPLVSPVTFILKNGPHTTYWLSTPVRLAWTFSVPFFAMYMFYILLKLGFALHKGETISVGKAFQHSAGEFFRFFGARLLFALKMIIGLFLLVIPGFYIASKYYFSGFPIVDGKTNAIGKDATLSGSMSQDNKWRILLVTYLSGMGGVIAVFILPLSIIFPPLIIVSLLTLPTMVLVQLHVYKQLEKGYLEASEKVQSPTV